MPEPGLYRVDVGFKVVYGVGAKEVAAHLVRLDVGDSSRCIRLDQHPPCAALLPAALVVVGVGVFE